MKFLLAIRKRKMAALAASAALVGTTGALTLQASGAFANYEAPISITSATDWQKTSWTGVKEVTRCAPGQVIVGVRREGLTNEGPTDGANLTRCATPSIRSEPGMTVATVGTWTKSDWLKEGAVPSQKHDCGAAPLVGRIHVNDDISGTTQYRCQELRIESKRAGVPLEAAVAQSTWSEWVPARDLEYTCPADTALTAREFHHSDFDRSWRFKCTSWKAIER